MRLHRCTVQFTSVFITNNTQPNCPDFGSYLKTVYVKENKKAKKLYRWRNISKKDRKKLRRWPMSPIVPNNHLLFLEGGYLVDDNPVV